MSVKVGELGLDMVALGSRPMRCLVDLDVVMVELETGVHCEVMLIIVQWPMNAVPHP
jgi:hypothetical protein